MIRVTDPDATIAIFNACRKPAAFSSEQGASPHIHLACPGQHRRVELTYNWLAEDGSAGNPYRRGRNFGHLAFAVEDIYATCQTLADAA
jgi:lactoylglutathione lyase